MMESLWDWGAGSTKFATKFTTRLVGSVRLITSAATDDSSIRFMFAAALPRRLRSFYAHDPDYVGVGGVFAALAVVYTAGNGTLAVLLSPLTVVWLDERSTVCVC